MKALVLSALAGAALAGIPAFAADFTFDVPVNIENMPSVVSFRVDCYVSRIAPGAAGAAASTENVIGRGTKNIVISGANYHATVTVEVDNTSIIPSADAKQYRCSINLRGGTSSTGPGYDVGSQMMYERVTGLHLDRAVFSAGGPLP
jgi:hypothetical protein